MNSEAGSSVPRRELGRHLRRAREDARITREAAAQVLEWSMQKLWRIESGITSLRATDVRQMGALYLIDDERLEAMMALARETKAKGWWHSYQDAIPPYFELFVGLEAAASSIRAYESEWIPGLLQTEEYILALSRVLEPDMSDEERRQQVAIKVERQALLTRRLPLPPELRVVLNEQVLRRPVDDRAVMSRQLVRLVHAAVAPRIELRVLPLAAGPHPAGAGAFALLDFPEVGANPEPATVYCEGATGALYLDRDAEVRTYRRIWSQLAEVTLDETESIRLISALAKEYTE